MHRRAGEKNEGCRESGGDYSPATARGIDIPRDSRGPDLAPLPAVTPIGPTWSSVNLQQNKNTTISTQIWFINSFKHLVTNGDFKYNNIVLSRVYKLQCFRSFNHTNISILFKKKNISLLKKLDDIN